MINDPARYEVWEALSILFLDTEISGDLAHIARVLAQSPYSLDELEHILRVEVNPVLKSNLSIMGGAWIWDGFDQDWLIAACSKRMNRKSSWFTRQVHSVIREDWEKVKQEIIQLRTAQTS